MEIRAIDAFLHALPHLTTLRVEAVELHEAVGGGITARLTPGDARAPCPRCRQPLWHVHSHYGRTVADLPWCGRRVALRLWTRRFRCRNAGSPRRVFCERLPALVPAYGRRTPTAAARTSAARRSWRWLRRSAG